MPKSARKTSTAARKKSDNGPGRPRRTPRAPSRFRGDEHQSDADSSSRSLPGIADDIATLIRSETRAIFAEFQSNQPNDTPPSSTLPLSSENRGLQVATTSPHRTLLSPASSTCVNNSQDVINNPPYLDGHPSKQVPNQRNNQTTSAFLHTQNNQNNMAAPMGDVTPFSTRPGTTSANVAVPPAHLHLPYIADNTINAVSCKGKYIDLSDFHKDITLPNSSSATKTHITLDTDNPSSACFTTHSKKKDIDSFQSWVQCFSTYAAYRSFYFPDDAIHLFNYMRFIADRAELYKPEAWLSYDKAFRLDAARYDRNWSLPNAQLDNAHFHASHRQHLLIPTCFLCKGKGHTKAECPRLHTTTGDQYHWNNPQQHHNRAAPINRRVCRDFNKGLCASPCIHGRQHICTTCFSTTHGALFHQPDMVTASTSRQNFRGQQRISPKPFRPDGSPTPNNNN